MKKAQWMKLAVSAIFGACMISVMACSFWWDANNWKRAAIAQRDINIILTQKIEKLDSAYSKARYSLAIVTAQNEQLKILNSRQARTMKAMLKLLNRYKGK